MKPLISIITVVLNGDKFLEETILSVINQTYKNIEFIIIDGGSTDGTIEIIKKYKNKITFWVSEKDGGISDAFNKGLNHTKGDYINFQGDGDGFINDHVLEDIFSHETTQIKEIICGNIRRISLDGKTIYTTDLPKLFNKKSLLLKMSLPHQGLFISRDFFKIFGNFDLDNKYCMDYEMLLRAYKDFPRVKIKQIVVAKWRQDGLGTIKTKEILNEYHQIRLKNSIANPILLLMIHYWSFTKYYAKKLWCETS